VTKSSLTNISIEDGRAFDLIRARTGYTGHINTPAVHLHPSTLATFSDTESKSSLIITAVRFVTLTRPVTHRSINVPTRRVSSRMLRRSVLISYGITKPLLGKVGFLSTCCRVQRPASHMWQRSGKSFLWEFSFDRSVDSPVVSRRVPFRFFYEILPWQLPRLADFLLNRSLNDRSGSPRAC